MLATTMARMLTFYEKQRTAFFEISGATLFAKRVEMAGEFIDRNKATIQWTEGLIGSLVRNQSHTFATQSIRIGHYRPFCRHAA